MMAGGLHHALLQIATGYGRSLRRIALTTLMIAATVTVSAGIVFPLWYFSTHDRTGYTVVVLCLLAAAILFLIFRKTRVFWELPSRERGRRVRHALVRVLVVLTFVVGLYITLGFYLVGFLAVALPLTAVYFFALGYTLYVRKSRKSS